MNALTKNLFEVLNENSRLDQTAKVLSAYAELMSAHRNELPLVVTSAKVTMEHKRGWDREMLIWMDIGIGQVYLEQDCRFSSKEQAR